MSANESQLGWSHKEPIGRVQPVPQMKPRGIPVATQKQSALIFKAIKSFKPAKAPARRVSSGKCRMRNLVSTQAIHITHRKIW